MGTIANIAGKVNGVDTVVAGTLNTANAGALDVNSVTASTNAFLPGTRTDMTATFVGDVTAAQTALTGTATMIVLGGFKEADGSKVAGQASTTINSGGAQVLNSSGGFYADKN